MNEFKTPSAIIINTVVKQKRVLMNVCDAEGIFNVDEGGIN